MQKQQALIALPPEDVLVSMFAFAIAAAHRFAREIHWRQLDEISLGLGRPYMIRAPSPSILYRLVDRTPAILRPYRYIGDNDFEQLVRLMGETKKNDVLIALDFDRDNHSDQPDRLKNPNCLYKARVWMIFNLGHIHRSAYLTVSRSPSERHSSGENQYIVRAEVDPEYERRRHNLKQRVWADNLDAVVFGGKARFLCSLPDKWTHVIRPERDAIVAIFSKEDGSLHQGKWHRRNGAFTERLILPTPPKESYQWEFYSFSLSPSGRYLSWGERPPLSQLMVPLSTTPPRERDVLTIYRCILDLARPVPRSPSSPSAPMRIPLSSFRYNSSRPIFWLDDEEWIEEHDTTDMNQPRLKGSWEWQIFRRHTGRVARTLVRLPMRTKTGEEIGLQLKGYIPSTRELVVHAFSSERRNKSERLERSQLCMIQRDTGVLRRSEMAIGQLTYVSLKDVRSNEKEFLWSSSIGVGGASNFITTSFWRSHVGGQLHPIVTLQQPSDNLADQDFAMPGQFDVNGDLLLRWSDALWVVNNNGS